MNKAVNDVRIAHSLSASDALAVDLWDRHPFFGGVS
jgi:hypothetical protein